MGLVPASDEFWQLVESYVIKWCIIDFDEVMTGFRASLKGASGILNVQADILTLKSNRCRNACWCICCFKRDYGTLIA